MAASLAVLVCRLHCSLARYRWLRKKLDSMVQKRMWIRTAKVKTLAYFKQLPSWWDVTSAGRRAFGHWTHSSHSQNRRQLRVFLRKDIYGRLPKLHWFTSRDPYNQNCRMKMQEHLNERLQRYYSEFTCSVLATCFGPESLSPFQICRS